MARASKSTSKFKPGDRVGFTRKFCKSIGSSPTDTCWRDKGTVLRTEKMRGVPPLVVVAWDHAPDEPRRVLAVNIAKVGSVRYVD